MAEAAESLETYAARLLELSGRLPQLEGQCAAAASAVRAAAELSSRGTMRGAWEHAILGDLEAVVAVLEADAPIGARSAALSAIGGLLADCCRAGVILSACNPSAATSWGPAVEAHARDAERDRRRGAVLLAVGLVLLIAATSVMTFAAVHYIDEENAVWPFLAAVAPSLIGAGASLWQADRLSRSSTEAMRSQRQLLALDPYLQPFPEVTKNIMRAVIAPRIFSRSLEDLDPLRDIRVPVSEVSRSLGVPNPDADDHAGPSSAAASSS